MADDQAPVMNPAGVRAVVNADPPANPLVNPPANPVVNDDHQANAQAAPAAPQNVHPDGRLEVSLYLILGSYTLLFDRSYLVHFF